MQPSSSKTLVPIYLQDEYTLGARTTYLSLTGVENGPQDMNCSIERGAYRLNKTGDGNFTYTPDTTKSFQVLSPLRVATSVKRMYTKVMDRLARILAFKKHPNMWNANTIKITIVPYHTDRLWANL